TRNIFSLGIGVRFVVCRYLNSLCLHLVYAAENITQYFFLYLLDALYCEYDAYIAAEHTSACAFRNRYVGLSRNRRCLKLLSVFQTVVFSYTGKRQMIFLCP